MENWVGKVAVITGASSGIGEAIAKNLVQSGLRVIGLARRKDKLESLKQCLAGAKGEFYAHECDISDVQNVEDAFLWIKKTFGAIHALINNAGYLAKGNIIDLHPSNFRKVFDINVLGLLYCTQQALRIMRETNVEGTIVNINSIEGHRVYVNPSIQLNVYPGSKHALTGIIESLQHELRDEKLKVRVTSVSPGLVKTEMVVDLITTLTADPEVTSEPVALIPEDIASAVAYVLSMPQRVQITELTIRPLGEMY